MHFLRLVLLSSTGTYASFVTFGQIASKFLNLFVVMIFLCNTLLPQSLIGSLGIFLGDALLIVCTLVWAWSMSSIYWTFIEILNVHFVLRVSAIDWSRWVVLCRLLFRVAKMQQDLLQAEDRVKLAKEEWRIVFRFCKLRCTLLFGLLEIFVCSWNIPIFVELLTTFVRWGKF